MGGPDAFSCKFDELGRFQFRRLCRELVAVELGVTATEWEETLVVPDGVRLPGAERPLAGPTVVASPVVEDGKRSGYLRWSVS